MTPTATGCYMRHGSRVCAVHLSLYPGDTGTACYHAIDGAQRDLAAERARLHRAAIIARDPAWWSVGDPSPIAHDARQRIRSLRRWLRAAHVPVPLHRYRA